MTTSLLRSALMFLLLALSLSACAGDTVAVGAGGDPELTATEPPIPVEPDGGIGDGAEPLPDQSASSDPIPVEGDGGIGDGAGPPDPLTEPPSFGVSSETDSLSAAPFSSCWAAPDAPGVCTDGSPAPDTNPITAADQLVVTYEPGLLQATATGDDGVPANLTLAEENPGIFLVSVSTLDPGAYELNLFWTGDQGDAATALALTVDRQA